ncbi:MAG: carboxypeptidase-like regulatory domain-containing protein [Prolixibacteraceae bacterium]|nr:carboxypeptidase-like regulatory domain-containing protein [Prolixibacteraceae bacterium]
MKRQTLFFLALLLSSLASSSDYVAFSGIISDARTGNVLEGVDIFLKDIETGTITNEKGEFFLFIMPGIYEVNIKIKGYNTESLTINFQNDSFYEIFLTPKINGYEPAKWILKNLEIKEDDLLITQGLNKQV